MSPSTLIKTLVTSVLLLSSVLKAEDLYVRPSYTSGAHTGADWTNAWNGFSDVKWGTGTGQVGPGDTLWVAGGTYTTQLQIGTNGSSGSRIAINRVLSTDAVPVAAAGWSSSFDSQVVIDSAGDGITFPSGNGSYVTIDGRSRTGWEGTYGWKIVWKVNHSGVVFGDRSTALTGATIKYLDINGPGHQTQTYDTRGMDLTVGPGGRIVDLAVQYCRIQNGGDTTFQIAGGGPATNVLIEYCQIEEAGALNPATFHPNILIDSSGMIDSTIRFNKFLSIEVEGVFSYGNWTRVKAYGNLFTGSAGGARGFEFQTMTLSDCVFFNNTFANLPIATFRNDTSTMGSSNLFKNNLYMNSGGVATGPIIDYNGASGSAGGSNPTNNITAPFVNAGSGDYHLVVSTAADKPRNKGTNLGAPYNVDMDGNLRGADGLWDLGAYEYTSGGPVSNTAPTIGAIGNQTTTGGTVGPLAFTVGDAETAAGSLAVSGASSNAALLPNSGISFGGSGANRTVTLSPVAGQTGTATVTVTASDGSLATGTSFSLTVTTGANTAPTIGAIANQTTTGGTVGPLAFTVGDAQTAAGSLTVSGASSNAALLPASGIVFGGSGASRTVTLSPAAGQTGTATVTVTVSDGSLATGTSFSLTINGALATNGLIAAYNFNEASGTAVFDASGNGNSGAIQGAAWTGTGRYGSALVFNGTSSLVQVPSSASLRIGAAMTLEAWVNPSAAQSGWRTIVQKEVDSYFLHASGNSALRPAAGGTFGGSVSFATAPAAIATNVWTHLAVTYDGTTMRLFVNGTQVTSQAQTGAIATSDTPLRIGGNAPYGEFFQGTIDEVRIYNRALAPSEIQADMASSVVVPVANTAPTIGVIASQTTITGTAVGPLAFAVGDAQTAAGSLTVSGASSNATLLPSANVVLGGSGANRTVTLSPVAGQTGTATVTLTVSDGSLTTGTNFTLTVNPPPNTAPTIGAIASQTTITGTAVGPLAFTVGDAETAAGSLTVSGASSNTTLLPSANVVLGGSGANRTVTLRPVAGQTGTATVTLTVSDGSLTTGTNFTLTVNPPPNTAPTIGAIANQTTTSGTAVGPLAFTVGDDEMAAGSLLVSASSGNGTLIPDGNIVLGGSGADRTVTVTPAAGLAGAASITLTVSDGTLSTSTSFTLAVNATLGRGLVAAYAFDEASGPTVHDLSGNGNDGAISGAAWTAGGRFGSALSFDGAGSLVQVPSSASLNLGSAMTLEAWVVPTVAQSGWRTIVQREVDGYFLHASSNRALRPAGGGMFSGKMKFIAASSPIAVGAWTHLAVTYDGATHRLYVNGALAATTPRTGVLETSDNPLSIGGNAPYGEYFQGLIDEVRIYNRALAAAEIQSDMRTSVTVQAAAALWGHADIGDVALPGSDAADPGTATITVEGSGADIGGTADAFRFLYRPLRGDGTVEARVESLTNTNPGAKAGVMIRESLAANAKNAFIFVVPSGEVGAQARTETGGATGASAAPTQPWIRLVRTGDAIVAAVSTDGLVWTAVATLTVPMGVDVYAGFAVTSHDDSQLATAVFGDPFLP